MAVVMWSCVIAEGVHIGPWVPVLGQTILIVHSAGARTSVKLNHFLIWGTFTSLGTWLFNCETSWHLCLTEPGAEVHYLRKFVQLGNPC